MIRGEGVYKLMYKFDGDFRTSYARNDFDKTEDWDLYANHAQDVSKRTRLTAAPSLCRAVTTIRATSTAGRCRSASIAS